MAVFFVVRLVGDVNQTFRVAVTEIGRMRRSVVYLKNLKRFNVNLGYDIERAGGSLTMVSSMG